MNRFRGGLVLKAHRLVYHSTLGSRVIKKKKRSKLPGIARPEHPSLEALAVRGSCLLKVKCSSLEAEGRGDDPNSGPFFFFFVTLVTGPRRSLSLKLSDTRVYEP